MRINQVYTFSLLALLMFMGAGSAVSAFAPIEVVHFPAKILPTPAHDNTNVSGEPKTGHPLWGHLSLPDGVGPHPAIVLLHGCGGIRQSHFHWAKTFNRAGFVTLVVDSFRPRSLIGVCGGGTEAASNAIRVLDAFGALEFLQDHEAIDPNRIGLMGWSHGAISALAAVSNHGVGEKFSGAFQAVVAMYPYCLANRSFFKPVSIMIGASDDWTPPSLCEDLKIHTYGDVHEVELTIYPAAFHAFDDPTLGSGFFVPGAHGQKHWLQYDQRSHHDALIKAQAFFKETL